MPGIVRRPRVVDVNLTFQIGESDLTDDQLAQYIQAQGNVLWFLLAFGMAHQPAPNSGVTTVTAKVRQADGTGH